jgi:hypothetical protein
VYLVTGYEVRVARYGFRVASCVLRGTGYVLRVTSFVFRVVHYEAGIVSSSFKYFLSAYTFYPLPKPYTTQFQKLFLGERHLFIS